MTSTATTARTPSHTAVAPLPVAVLTALVGIGWTAYGAHTWSELITMAALVAVATVLVFGLVVTRALRKESAGGTALALSIPAVLLALPAFWSGLPLILGAAGALVGHAGRNARHGSAKCAIGLVLGLIAVLGYLALYLGDGVIAGHGGFLVD